MNPIKQMQKQVHWLFSLSRDEMSWGLRTTRFLVELGMYCGRQLRRDNAPQMAAALTYRTIFSLVPTVVLSVILLQAFTDLNSMRGELQDRAFEFFGLHLVQYQDDEESNGQTLTDKEGNPIDPDQKEGGSTGEGETEDPATIEETTPGEKTPAEEEPVPLGEPLIVELPDGAQLITTTAMRKPPSQSQAVSEAKEEAIRDSITKVLNDLTNRASRISFGGIGAAGAILLIWGALMLAVTVESTFNRVFNCPRGRPWHRRIPVYWAVLTLGPALAAVSLIMVRQFQDWLGNDSTWTTHLIDVSGRFTGLIASWLLFSLMYVLMPNTKVKFKPALIGAFVAALLWEIAKWGFALYVSQADPFSSLYGSLGLIPLFLIWLHLTWMIILFGLELTYTLQGMAGGKFERERTNQQLKQMCDARAVIPLMTALGRRFEVGEFADREQLSLRLRLPTLAVSHMLRQLEEARMVNEVERNEDDGYALARPPERILIKDLLELASQWQNDHADGADEQVGWEYLDELNEVQENTVSTTTLADLLNRAPQASDEKNDDD